MDQALRRCFISHSYQDSAVLDAARAALPEGVEAVIFPRMASGEAALVSEHIIPLLLSCDGLVHLRGGASASSFWVAFERDYALRSGLKVYAFDPEGGALAPDDGAPLKLDVEVYYNRRDGEAVKRLLDWMARERHFDLSDTVGRGLRGGIKGDDIVGMEETIGAGGVVLWLMTQALDALAGTFFTFLDEGYESDILRQEFGDEDPYAGVRSVFALLDPAYRARSFTTGAPLIELLRGAPSDRVWRRPLGPDGAPPAPDPACAALYPRIDPRFRERLLAGRPAFIDVSTMSGEESLSAPADDLIVALYRALLAG